MSHNPIPLKSRKKRKKLWDRPTAESGALGDIARLFIKPLIRMKPEEMELSEWLCLLFHVDDRTIQEYVALKKFDLPGKFRLLPTKSIDGYGHRKMRAGCSIFVRTDKRNPERIEVETTAGHGQRQQLFILTVFEWKTILPHLMKIGKRRAPRLK